MDKMPLPNQNPKVRNSGVRTVNLEEMDLWSDLQSGIKQVYIAGRCEIN